MFGDILSHSTNTILPVMTNISWCLLSPPRPVPARDGVTARRATWTEWSYRYIDYILFGNRLTITSVHNAPYHLPPFRHHHLDRVLRQLDLAKRTMTRFGSVKLRAWPPSLTSSNPHISLHSSWLRSLCSTKSGKVVVKKIPDGEDMTK
jgi:hypothetical protein